jgi:predicted nucleic acid-binding protein
MTLALPVGVVVDTMVISRLFDQRTDPVVDQYRAMISTIPVVLAFQTVMELRYGALHAGWGELRRLRLERRIAEFSIAQPDDAMISICAELRQECQQLGHPLGNKVHNGDRWIAAVAIRLGLPLVSDDGVFVGAPRLELITAAPT